MKNVCLLICILLMAASVACGGNERAKTVELPTASAVETATNEAEPTKEATTEPTEAPSPQPEVTETAVPTNTPEPTDIPEPTDTPEPTNTPEPPKTDLDEENLKASLLTINDMPTGWTGKAAEFEVRTPGAHIDLLALNCQHVPWEMYLWIFKECDGSILNGNH
ncbi:MAG: hypothetical protein IPK53_03765 [bacterium]|nr:hypothetical protein [bacterium]